jgi:hypothetical protein
MLMKLSILDWQLARVLTSYHVGNWSTVPLAYFRDYPYRPNTTILAENALNMLWESLKYEKDAEISY